MIVYLFNRKDTIELHLENRFGAVAVDLSQDTIDSILAIQEECKRVQSILTVQYLAAQWARKTAARAQEQTPIPYKPSWYKGKNIEDIETDLI